MDDPSRDRHLKRDIVILGTLIHILHGLDTIYMLIIYDPPRGMCDLHTRRVSIASQTLCKRTNYSPSPSLYLTNVTHVLC